MRVGRSHPEIPPAPTGCGTIEVTFSLFTESLLAAGRGVALFANGDYGTRARAANSIGVGYPEQHVELHDICRLAGRNLPVGRLTAGN